MTIRDLIEFVGDHRYGVVATLGAAGEPQAAIVGIAVTDRGEVVFDALPDSRKAINVNVDERVALVVLTDNEATLQCEGAADRPPEGDLARCQETYFKAFPEGRQRAVDGAILIRITPHWARISDFRPGSFGTREVDLTPD
jgi:hypothetical protein